MPQKPPTRPDTEKVSSREERLAAALRENLRRRKVQSRERQETAEGTEPAGE